jgi:cell cycle sensor histidine kinase DivJ
MTPSAPAPREPPALAVLAHELRDPLAALTSMADLLRTQALGPLPVAYVEYGRLMHDTGRHMLSVLAALGEAAVEAPPAAAGACVRDVVAAVRPRADAARICLDAIIDSSVGEAEVARRPLTQILHNLLANALDFTAEGGRIAVRLARKDEHLLVEVSDSGCGKRNGAGGSGVGLSIVRALCASQGGDLAIDISPVGTTARVRLRAADA